MIIIILKVLFMGEDHEGVAKGKMSRTIDWKTFFKR